MDAEIKGVSSQEKARLQQEFVVSYQYSVIFSRHIFSLPNQTLLELLGSRTNCPNKLLIVIDSGVLASHPDLIDEIKTYFEVNNDRVCLVANPLVVPGGEHCKNITDYVEKIQRAVSEFGICRHSYIIAIGGGAVLDAVGFAAATAHRGIRLVRVPTTVLSQNDSGVGVKTAINAFNKKNFLGTFSPPLAVVNDSLFLTTLDERDWRSGIAEAIKVALIKDAEFFSFIESNVSKLVARDMPAMEQVIYRCAQLHMDHIGKNGDPFETGSSRPLDFGHWSAHKLEHLSNYRLRHGEAVAIGIVLDCIYSNLIGTLDNSVLDRVIDVIGALGFSLWERELGEQTSAGDMKIILGLEEFREHLGGILTFTLLRDVGIAFDAHEYDVDIYIQALLTLEKIASKSVTPLMRVN